MSDENQKKPQVVDGVWASGGDASKMPSDQVVEVSGGQVTGQTPPVTVSNTSNVSDGPVAQPPGSDSLDSVWTRDATAATAQGSPQNIATPVQPSQQPAAFMPQSSFQPTDTPQKNPKIKMMVLGIIAAFVVLGGIGGGTYWYMYNNHPDKILADAMFGSVEDMIAQKPMEMNGELSFKAAQTSGSNDQMPTVSVKFNSATSGKESKGSLAAKVVYGGQDYSLGVEAVAVAEGESYFKINDLEKTINSVVKQMPDMQSSAASLSPIVKKIDGRWIKITEKDLKELGLYEEQSATECTKAIESIKMSKKDEKKMKSSYKKNQFMSVTEKMGTEEINGQKSEHYKLGFDTDKAKSFSNDLFSLESVKPVAKTCKVEAKDMAEAIDQAQSKVEKLRKKDGKMQVEMWVNKETRRPTKVGVNGDGSGMSVNFSTATQFDAKDLAIQKPKDVVEFKSLVKDIEALMQSDTSVLGVRTSAL